MLFNKETQKAILLAPKTGTTTSRQFLKSAGWNVIPPYYQYPEFYIQKYPNLQNYTIYLFLRDPVDRFVSAIKHMNREPIFSEQLSEMLQNNSADISIYEKAVNCFDELKNQFGIFFEPQSRWATPSNVEILDFDNYESELRRITGADESVKVPVLNKAPEADLGPVSDQVREFIKTAYAEDYALAKERLGKEYV
jgi:hypothetical protein